MWEKENKEKKKKKKKMKQNEKINLKLINYLYMIIQTCFTFFILLYKD